MTIRTMVELAGRHYKVEKLNIENLTALKKYCKAAYCIRGRRGAAYMLTIRPTKNNGIYQALAMRGRRTAFDILITESKLSELEAAS